MHTHWNKSFVHAGSGYVLKMCSAQSFLRSILHSCMQIAEIFADASMQLLYNTEPIQRAILLDLRNTSSFEKIQADNSVPA